MELLVWMGLCVLLFPQLVSARMTKREVTVDCTNFSSMMQDAKVCIYQHDNIRLASGLILETSQLEVLWYSMCRALPEIRNCMKEKYGSCLHIDNILEKLVSDAFCQGDQPNEWLADYYLSNPVVDVNETCAREIEKCTKPNWMLEYIGSDFFRKKLRFEENSSVLRWLRNVIIECIKPLMGDSEAVCGHSDGIESSPVWWILDIQISMMPFQILGNMMAD